jgi:hypothetical protein
MRRIRSQIAGGSRIGVPFLTTRMDDTASPINVLAARQTGDAIVTFMPPIEK